MHTTYQLHIVRENSKMSQVRLRPVADGKALSDGSCIYIGTHKQCASAFVSAESALTAAGFKYRDALTVPGVILSSVPF